VTYWREEPVESTQFAGELGNWAIEIKTGGFELYDSRDFWSSAAEIRSPALIITGAGDEPLAADTACWHQAGSNSGRRPPNPKKTPAFSFPLLNALLRSL